MRNELEKRYMEPEELSRGYPWVTSMGRRVRTMDEANLITSRISKSLDWVEERAAANKVAGRDIAPPTQRHYILLDLDHEAELIPTSTSGHFHLYIKHAVTSVQLDKFVEVCEEIGLIQPGIKKGWKERGALCLRKPGVIKGVETP